MLKEASKIGCFKGLYDLGSHMFGGKFIEQNFVKGIKKFILSYSLGYMYSADHLILSLNKNMI